MKRTDSMLLLWPVLHAAADFLALTAAMILGYMIRFSSAFGNLVPVLHGVPSFLYYVRSAVVAGVFWTLFLAVRGVYRVRLDETVGKGIRSALGSFILGFALLFALLFFYREFLYSRVVALLTLVLGSFFLVLVRLLLGALQTRLLPMRPLHRALVLGVNQEAVAERLRGAKESGLQLVDGIPDTGDGPPAEDLVSRVEQDTVDTLILAYGFDQFARARQAIDRLGGKRLNFLFAPDPRAMMTGRIAPVTVAGLPMLRLREDPLAGWNGLIKRSFDLAVSTLLLVLLSPLYALLALLVRLTSRGPVIYRQTRVGLDNRPFSILKFRTMRVDAEVDTGPVWATKDDVRTTPIGRFLRRWSLDELPQLWNVLRGDMSLVGPRPERPAFVDEFRESVPRYHERHRVRSGMTGWAQVNGLRGQAPIEDRTRYDIFYIENWSLGFDLRILARTVGAVLFGRDAY